MVGLNGAARAHCNSRRQLPDHEGTIRIDGQTVKLTGPAVALAHGIAMVYQELSGIGQLSVAENLFLGRQPTTRLGNIDWRSMNDQAHRFLREMEIDVDVTRRLDRFPLVIRQMVEIARGLHSGARVLILDEPTSSLSPPETRRLFTLGPAQSARWQSYLSVLYRRCAGDLRSGDDPQRRPAGQSSRAPELTSIA